MQITLSQFEAIDELFKACLARPELEAVQQHPLCSADYIRNTYFLPEWKLLDACIEAAGYDYVNDFASTVDCAAHILTACLLGTCDVLDLEAA